MTAASVMAFSHVQSCVGSERQMRSWKDAAAHCRAIAGSAAPAFIKDLDQGALDDFEGLVA